MPLNPGATLGSYEILSPIGAGGMGEVYKAPTPAWTAPSPSRFCPSMSPRTPI